MHKLLKEEIFLRLIKADGYEYQGIQIDLDQIALKIICSNNNEGG